MLGMKLLKMGKDVKVKRSDSFLPNYGGTFFLERSRLGEQTFLNKFMGGLFYMETNDQIMPWGRGNFINAFSSNLSTANLKIFSQLCW